MIDYSRKITDKTITYIVITFALSSVFYYLMISFGGLMAASGIYATELMWCPGIASLAVISLVIAFIFWKKRSELP